MVSKLFENPETRRILIYLGAAGLAAIVGGSVYAAAMNAVTPSSLARAQSQSNSIADGQSSQQQVTQPVNTTMNTDTAASTSTGRTLVFEGQVINVDVADTDATREQGLSGRPGLAPNQGMLFVFPRDGVYGFWMKDMRFSLDMVWLDHNGMVVYFIHDISPDTYPASFIPDQSARYVIELPAGWTTAHGVRIGDQVNL